MSASGDVREPQTATFNFVIIVLGCLDLTVPDARSLVSIRHPPAVTPINTFLLLLPSRIMDSSEGASKGANANLSRSTPDHHQTPSSFTPHGGGSGGQMTTPPSPFTDTTSSSALALSAFFSGAGTDTPNTDLTSLPSDISKLSLGPAKKSPPLLTEPEPPAVLWPYSRRAALDDIPGIAYVLNTFLKSQMVESEEYCHRNDPQKYVRYASSRFFPFLSFFYFCKN